MPASLTGRCLCGAVRWRADAEPMFSAHCACDNCRRMSGAEHASFFAIPATAVEIGGETRSFTHKADSGATVTRHVCAGCGTTAWLANDRNPALRVLPAGGLDDIGRFRPEMFVFHAKRAPWDGAGAGCRTFDAMPPVPA